MSRISNSDGSPPENGPLEIPSFRLPADIDSKSSRWELWSVRLPDGLSLADLEGSQATVTGSTFTTIQTTDGRSFVFQEGDPCENACFRILQPASKQSEDVDESDSDRDEDDDDDDSKAYYTPSQLPFARHWNVVSYLPPMADDVLAPSSDRAPTPRDAVRHAYAPVPQRSGLKRRWTPLGGRYQTSGSGAPRSDDQAESPPPAAQNVEARDSMSTKSHSLTFGGQQEPGQATAAPEPKSTADLDKLAKRLAKKAKKEAKKARKEHKHKDK